VGECVTSCRLSTNRIPLNLNLKEKKKHIEKSLTHKTFIFYWGRNGDDNVASQTLHCYKIRFCMSKKIKLQKVFINEVKLHWQKKTPKSTAKCMRPEWANTWSKRLFCKTKLCILIILKFCSEHKIIGFYVKYAALFSRTHGNKLVVPEKVLSLINLSP
jgi:hypothetical protein